MARVLAPDDLVPGDVITVFQLLPLRIRTARGSSPRDAIAQVMAMGPVPLPPPGAPMLVMAVDLPFVLTQVILPGGQLDGPIVLDLRRVQLAQMSPSFLQALQAMPGSAPGGDAGADDAATDDPSSVILVSDDNGAGD